MKRPVVASYCATFLKPEMLHIYRQLTALERVHPVVIAQKRENAERFPFKELFLVRKPTTHFLRRIWHRQLRDRPWKISIEETAELMRLLNLHGAKLLHIYFGHIAVHLRPLIHAWARPTIVSFHGADVGVDLEKPAYRAATEAMLAAVRHVLVRSDSLKRALIELGCAPEKVELHRAGIPLAEFPFRARSAPAQGEWRLLQASRLIEKKGIATSLAAFAQFTETFPRATLTIAGDGPLENDLKVLAQKLGVSSRVQFAGFVSQERLRELLYSAHMFIHPSETGRDRNQEGVPNSMLEAMATGLPVFATRHGGIPEAVEDGVSGRLVNERDYQTLADVLISAARSSQCLARMGRAAAERVAATFDHAEQTRRLEEIYLREIAR